MLQILPFFKKYILEYLVTNVFFKLYWLEDTYYQWASFTAMISQNFRVVSP